LNTPSWCRLCNDSEESRSHLLTDCPATCSLVADFISRIRKYSPNKVTEFSEVPTQDRWLWILGAGCIPLKLDPVSYGPDPPTHIFELGKSVEPGFSRDNLQEVNNAFFEFKEIENSIDNDDSLVVYTDGSFKDDLSGAGAAVFRNGKLIKRLRAGTGDLSNSFAEIYAFLIALQWLKFDIADVVFRKKCTVHFFTDSVFFARLTV